MRLIVVDDAPIERAVLARMARYLGHEVVAEVADLASAVRATIRFRPDLVIVDGRLPPDGCIVALPVLRDADPSATLAIIAAVGEIDLVRSAVAAGAAGALRRPLLRSAVRASLEEMAAGR